MKDHDELRDLIYAGDMKALEEVAQTIEHFPDGCDDSFNDTWLSHAIDSGPFSVVEWMLKQGVKVDFKSGDGYTTLQCAIDRDEPHKYEILRMLIEAGADLNSQGLNDWTPAHLAAARHDLRSLQMIVEAGADLNIRTRIDDYNTPLEEAEMLNCPPEIIEYLKQQSYKLNQADQIKINKTKALLTRLTRRLLRQ